VFENATSEIALQQEITDAVVQAFVRDNHLKVVDEKSANCVIRGKVVAYKNDVFGFTSATQAQEYRVSITVHVVFKDLVKNREFWSDDLVKTANYYTVSVPGQVAKTPEEGRKDAVAKISEEILSRSVEGW